MKVTVLEQVEHSADITAEMVIEYALRHGWTVIRQCPEAVDLGTVEPEDFIVIWRNGAHLEKRVEWLARHENRKPHEVLADIADGQMKTLCDDWIQRNHDTAKRAYESGGCVLGITAGNAWYLFAEIIALRKQAILDRQSREASQVEFARLNRELNEAKERIQVLLDEIADTAIAAGMMDPGQRGAIDGPNAIQFLRLMREQYERK